MILKFNNHQRGGFSLLEMTIVVIIITILASAAIPQLVNGYLVQAANKTALDISSIEDASRAYFIKYSAWPVSITPVANQSKPLDLESNGFLPQNWNAINPFGNSSSTPSTFSYSIAQAGSYLTVSTYVPNSIAQNIIQNLLPGTTPPSSGIVSSSIPPPGAS